MERSDIGRSISEETHRYLPGSSFLRSPSSAGGDREVCTDNCVRTHGVLFDIGEMHRSAFAPTTTDLSAKEFTHERVHRCPA